MNPVRRILEQQKAEFRAEDRKAEKIHELERENYELLAAIDEKDALLREALDAMINLSPRVKQYDGCFGRMAGGLGGEDCTCTACKIKREIGQ